MEAMSASRNGASLAVTLHHPGQQQPQQPQPQHPTAHHILPMQPTVAYPMPMGVDDARMSHQIAAQRSSYESSMMAAAAAAAAAANGAEDIYSHQRSAEHARANYMQHAGPTNIARPVVTYSNEIAAARVYENASTANHRPYDPGAAAAYERYDTQACTPLQAQQQQQQLHARANMYYLGQTGMTPEEQERVYHQEAAVAAQQHQMAMAAASVASMMKNEDGMLNQSNFLNNNYLYCLFYILNFISS